MHLFFQSSLNPFTKVIHEVMSLRLCIIAWDFHADDSVMMIPQQSDGEM
jgi:hypothetical protein